MYWGCLCKRLGQCGSFPEKLGDVALMILVSLGTACPEHRPVTPSTTPSSFRDKQRMYFALKSLLQEAQNNLKIFKVSILLFYGPFWVEEAGAWIEPSEFLGSGPWDLADEDAWAGSAMAQSCSPFSKSSYRCTTAYVSLECDVDSSTTG